jgi:hypothetical protein
MQITADRSYGKNPGTWQKVEKRLLFDGINMYRAGISINNGSQYAVDIDSHPALTALTGFNQTCFRT